MGVWKNEHVRTPLVRPHWRTRCIVRDASTDRWFFQINQVHELRGPVWADGRERSRTFYTNPHGVTMHSWRGWLVRLALWRAPWDVSIAQYWPRPTCESAPSPTADAKASQ
jgi:hypothetical protein